MEIDSLKYPFSMTLYFIPEFVIRMRRASECVDKPSPRQSIVMSRLLLPAYLKKGYLSFEDLVDASILTSRIENQNLAERIASEILLGTTEKDEAPPMEEPPASLMPPKKDGIKPRQDKGDSGEDFQPQGDSEVDILRQFTNKPDLGVGPGEDELLKSDIRSIRGQAEEETKKRLREILRAMLLKLGRELERKMDNLQDQSLRPFEPYEDPDRIDEDRSLENIFESGRRLSEVRYDDFLMRNLQNKRRTIIYILDVSNTMFYNLDGINSIHYSILCLIPLMYALRREKYGLVLYESNSHVMKEIADEGDEERLIDALLSMIDSNTTDVEKSFSGTSGSHLWGGTVPNKSLKWAAGQLEEAGDRSEKLCVIFSDFVLDDIGTTQPEKQEAYEAIEMMINKGVRVAACVSPLAYGELFSKYTKHSIPRIKKLGCEMVETERPVEFLDKIQAFMNAS